MRRYAVTTESEFPCVRCVQAGDHTEIWTHDPEAELTGRTSTVKIKGAVTFGEIYEDTCVSSYNVDIVAIDSVTWGDGKPLPKSLANDYWRDKIREEIIEQAIFDNDAEVPHADY